ILSDSNPNQNKSAAKSFFTKMSQKYQSYDNVIYEICNEPNGGTTWSQIKSYADEIIAVIRKYDKDAIIIVGTPTWSQDVDEAAKNPLSNSHNVMYAVHFYAATHKQWLRDKVKSALDMGAPVFVSEFSICDASGNGSIDYAEANKWKSFINDNKLSYAGWNLSNKAETSALIKSGCNKTSNWSQSDLSDTGKWLRKMIKG
ncbi:MAG: glycoside hydrolase family 5 protein, partial [Acutalibacteraceae bacterium]